MDRGDSIELSALFAELRASWVTCTCIVAAGAVLALAATFLLVPKYRVDVVLVPALDTNSGGALSGLSGQLAGVAALAGFDIPAQQNKVESIEYLKSRDLIAKFVAEHKLLPLLFPGKWDSERQRWKDERVDRQPNLADGIRVFSRRVRAVSEDRRTGIVTLSMTWKQRQDAARWADEFVKLANVELRRRTIDEAQRSLKFLEDEARKTDELQVREALYRLVENQLKTIMLANSREDYAFRVIDPARIPEPEDFVSPQRVVITVAGAALGALLCIGLLMVRASRKLARAAM